MDCHKNIKFVAKYDTMGANSSYMAMYNIIEQAKEGTVLVPDDFTTWHSRCSPFRLPLVPQWKVTPFCKRYLLYSVI